MAIKINEQQAQQLMTDMNALLGSLIVQKFADSPIEMRVAEWIAKGFEVAVEGYAMEAVREHNAAAVP